MKRVDKEQLISIKSYVAKNAKMTKEEQLCLFDIADKLLFYQENGEYEIFIKRNGSRFNFKNFQAKNFDYDDFYHAISYLLQLKLCGIAEYDFYDQFFPIGEFKLNVKPQKIEFSTRRAYKTNRGMFSFMFLSLFKHDIDKDGRILYKKAHEPLDILNPDHIQYMIDEINSYINCNLSTNVG